MLKHNTKMKEFLEAAGFVNIIPKYLDKGSLKGCWRIVSRINGQPNLTGYALQTPDAAEKLTALGFIDFDRGPLNPYSGNGGLFAIFARFTKEAYNHETL